MAEKRLDNASIISTFRSKLLEIKIQIQLARQARLFGLVFSRKLHLHQLHVASKGSSVYSVSTT